MPGACLGKGGLLPPDTKGPMLLCLGLWPALCRCSLGPLLPGSAGPERPTQWGVSPWSPEKTGSLPGTDFQGEPDPLSAFPAG